MNHIRVLVANDPRSYRETMAAAFRKLRPRAEVVLVEPADLDAEVIRRAPNLVVCSALSEVVETRAPAWVVLYPEGRAAVCASVAGERTDAADIGLGELVALIDRVGDRSAGRLA